MCVSGKDTVSIARLGRYGLGNTRTLDQLIQFTGMDFRRRLVFGDRCQALHWVAFDIINSSPFVDTLDVWLDAPERVSAGAGLPLISGKNVVVLSVTTEETTNGNDVAVRTNSEKIKHGNNKLRGEKNPLAAPHLQSGKYIVGGVDLGTV